MPIYNLKFKKKKKKKKKKQKDSVHFVEGRTHGFPCMGPRLSDGLSVDPQ